MANSKKATPSEVSQKADPDLLAQADRKAAEKAKFWRDLFGAVDPNFAHGLLRQLEQASFSNGKFSEGYLRYLESIIASEKPRDAVEAMLLSQMAAIQKLIFDQFLKLALSPDDNEILSNIVKLTRTFIMQMDALKRYRSKPEQQVVQNVMVAQGGQAIVGNVHPQHRQDAGASPPVLTHSSERPMQPLAEVPKEVVKRGRRK